MRRLRNKTEVRERVSSKSTGWHYAVWKQRLEKKGYRVTTCTVREVAQ